MHDIERINLPLNWNAVQSDWILQFQPLYLPKKLENGTGIIHLLFIHWEVREEASYEDQSRIVYWETGMTTKFYNLK